MWPNRGSVRAFQARAGPGHSLEAWRAERARRRAQPLTSQYPEPTGPALQLANSGALLQPGQGPGPWAASRCSALPWAAPVPLPRGMSLLTNYEGLRHQIERLVRENEELKKLVQLIRENHELRSAIKTQAGGLGISGFSSGLGEAAASPPQRPGNCKTARREGGSREVPERGHRQQAPAGTGAPAGEGGWGSTQAIGMEVPPAPMAGARPLLPSARLPSSPKD